MKFIITWDQIRNCIICVHINFYFLYRWWEEYHDAIAVFLLHTYQLKKVVYHIYEYQNDLGQLMVTSLCGWETFSRYMRRFLRLDYRLHRMYYYHTWLFSYTNLFAPIPRLLPKMLHPLELNLKYWSRNSILGSIYTHHSLDHTQIHGSAQATLIDFLIR